MVPGVHYVSYDGTVPDLMNKVRHYQANIGELEQIAQHGYEFALNRLNPETVYKKFFDRLGANLEA